MWKEVSLHKVKTIVVIVVVLTKAHLSIEHLRIHEITLRLGLLLLLSEHHRIDSSHHAWATNIELRLLLILQRINKTSSGTTCHWNKRLILLLGESTATIWCWCASCPKFVKLIIAWEKICLLCVVTKRLHSL